VLSIHRAGRTIYITGHSSPSSAPLLVLSEALELKRTLDGWPMLVMRDGRVVFQRSMIHFAPAHAAAVALYDPATDRETPLYPPRSVKNERGIEPAGDLWQDRSIGTVTQVAPDRIQFEAIEQSMRLDSTQRAEPASAQRRITVTCDLSRNPPGCTIRDSR
jgi:hypothetical protein